MFMGQTSLWISAFVIGSWYHIRHGSQLVAGVLLALAGAKPQLMAFVFLWYLLERRWLAILVCGVTTFLMTAYPGFVIGWQETFGGWISSLNGYHSGSINFPGNPFILGIHSFLAACGWMTPLWVWFAVGVVALLLLWTFCRTEKHSVLLLGTLFLMQFLFLKSHTYEPLAKFQPRNCS